MKVQICFLSICFATLWINHFKMCTHRNQFKSLYTTHNIFTVGEKGRKENHVLLCSGIELFLKFSFFSLFMYNRGVSSTHHVCETIFECVKNSFGIRIRTHFACLSLICPFDSIKLFLLFNLASIQKWSN